MKTPNVMSRAWASFQFWAMFRNWTMFHDSFGEIFVISRNFKKFCAHAVKHCRDLCRPCDQKLFLFLVHLKTNICVDTITSSCFDAWINEIVRRTAYLVWTWKLWHARSNRQNQTVTDTANNGLLFRSVTFTGKTFLIQLVAYKLSLVKNSAFCDSSLSS